ncbi:MAG TPA: hypothetical protein PJ992_03380 [Arachnia sp.]|jgi:putative ABC transport system permease protein|nr:hypothetical protein [Arachnia sp.]HMR12823.1 hypothetical protein [Arachnia sp.]
MRAWVLAREALATAWANKVPSTLVALLVAAMVAGTLATVGRTAAAEEQLSERMDAAGSRLLTVRDARGKGLLSPTIVAQSAGLSGVERAAGTLSAIDVVTGAVGQGGERVAAWGVTGGLDGVVTLTAGRWPEPGEALVSGPAMAILGLTSPYGFVAEAAANPEEFGIVGSYAPLDPFDDYGAGLVYNAAGRDADTLWVVAAEPRHAAAAQQAVLGIVAPDSFEDIQVTSPVGMAELRDQVLGDLGAFGRTLLLGVLGAGGLLTAVVVLADVLVRRKDLGRRRALGASRGVIVGIVTARTFAPALLGAALGCASGLWVAARLGAAPPLDFVGGVAVLAVLSATFSAVPPALFAATRDPVAVLRTP